MRLDGGTLHLGRIDGVDLRVHWSFPFGVVVFSATDFSTWRLATVVALLLLHGLGHLTMCRLAGAEPTALTLSGSGGDCAYQPGIGPLARAAIAWGGVCAQLILFLGATWVWFNPSLGGPARPVVLAVGLERNALLMLWNLMPLGHLDGTRAWVLPLLLGRRLRDRLGGARRLARRRLPLGTTAGDES